MNSRPSKFRPAMWLGAALLISGLSAAPPAAAQSATSMAWVFDGPGCRQSNSPPPPGACADEALAKELLGWLHAQVAAGPQAGQGAHAHQTIRVVNRAHSPQTAQATSLPTPRLETLDQAGLSARLCPDTPAECRGIMAAYDAPTHTVILRDFLDMRRAPDRSFLVHELVHVMQHQRQGSAFQARCSDVVSTEREAYDAQNRYLAAQGQLQRVGQMIGQMVCPREDGEPVLRMGGLPGGSLATGPTTTPAGPAQPLPKAR